MKAECSINIQVYHLSAPLQPFFTALYYFDTEGPTGHYVEDHLFPEWAGMRFTQQGQPSIMTIGRGAPEAQPPFVVDGPTSRAVRFRLMPSRVWAVGLHPAGWAQFVKGQASDFANRTFDGSQDNPFALFAPIQTMLRHPPADRDEIASSIDAFLVRHLDRPVPQLPAIIACHEALQDPDVAHVGELVERVGMASRSLERLCARYFGFPPKALLRRQRFLRSLAQFMLNGRSNWSAALDPQYFDQAHFVREFRDFMGMAPSRYAEMPHPFIDRILAQRMADQGAVPRTGLKAIPRNRALAVRRD